jgi:hypothetical protein
MRANRNMDGQNPRSPPLNTSHYPNHIEGQVFTHKLTRNTARCPLHSSLSVKEQGRGRVQIVEAAVHVPPPMAVEMPPAAEDAPAPALPPAPPPEPAAPLEEAAPEEIERTPDTTGQSYDPTQERHTSNIRPRRWYVSQQQRQQW